MVFAVKLTPAQWQRVKWASSVMVSYGLDEIWNDDKWEVTVEGLVIYFKHPHLGTLAMSNPQ